MKTQNLYEAHYLKWNAIKFNSTALVKLKDIKKHHVPFCILNNCMRELCSRRSFRSISHLPLTVDTNDSTKQKQFLKISFLWTKKVFRIWQTVIRKCPRLHASNEFLFIEMLMVITQNFNPPLLFLKSTSFRKNHT